MREELQALKEQALKELETAASVDALKDLRVKYLGKKGHMTDILRGMGSLPAEERPKIGQIVNEVKKILEEAIAAKAEVLEAEALKHGGIPTQRSYLPKACRYWKYPNALDTANHHTH